MAPIYQRFLKRLPEGGVILDAGCGAGRDILEFVRRGYAVDAFDASLELCRIGSLKTGVPIQHLTFQEFSSEAKYDGVWACASLLHVPMREMSQVLASLIHSLKPGGVFYASFKHGEGERHETDGRFFLDMTESRLRSLFEPFSSVTINDVWISGGEGSRAGRGDWINVIATKENM
nr:class I SAM-dependent methyltransferase [Oricola nitratireducens]